ncbi:hypothetical protein HDU67_007235 [Dinochytrium kinnereticum]|nr:hypothetical protein HDU67_007235 [Dinochytrium kinnereticum]
MADLPKEARIAELTKQRGQIYDEINKKKDQIRKETEVKIGAEKFVAQNDVVQSELIKHTVGLVKLEDFQRIRENLDKRRQEEIEAKLAKSSLAASLKKKRKKETKSKLSFAEDEEEEKEEDEEEDDRERELAEQREREMLKLEWLKQQEKIKQEKISITYSYWDGSGHRKSVDCKKGDSIGHFLELCRQQQPELRGVNVDNLIYVKEDLIIPHHYTFYDFIINQTRGKSGPLFAFDVFDDVRLTNDASVETEESHAGKVIQRSWYEKNKHIFPASRWEVFDPKKVFEKYTIKDLNKSKT